MPKAKSAYRNEPILIKIETLPRKKQTVECAEACTQECAFKSYSTFNANVKKRFNYPKQEYQHPKTAVGVTLSRSSTLASVNLQSSESSSTESSKTISTKSSSDTSLKSKEESSLLSIVNEAVDESNTSSSENSDFVDGSKPVYHIPERYHGEGCALEICILEKHKKSCRYWRKHSGTSEERVGEYRIIGRRIIRTCNDFHLCTSIGKCKCDKFEKIDKLIDFSPNNICPCHSTDENTIESSKTESFEGRHSNRFNEPILKEGNIQEHQKHIENKFTEYTPLLLKTFTPIPADGKIHDEKSSIDKISASIVPEQNQYERKLFNTKQYVQSSPSPKLESTHIISSEISSHQVNIAPENDTAHLSSASELHSSKYNPISKPIISKDENAKLQVSKSVITGESGYKLMNKTSSKLRKPSESIISEVSEPSISEEYTVELQVRKSVSLRDTEPTPKDKVSSEPEKPSEPIKSKVSEPICSKRNILKHQVRNYLISREPDLSSMDKTSSEPERPSELIISEQNSVFARQPNLSPMNKTSSEPKRPSKRLGLPSVSESDTYIGSVASGKSVHNTDLPDFRSMEVNRMPLEKKKHFLVKYFNWSKRKSDDKKKRK